MMIGYIAGVVLVVAVMAGAAYIANHSTGVEHEIAEEVEQDAETILKQELMKKL